MDLEWQNILHHVELFRPLLAMLFVLNIFTVLVHLAANLVSG